MTDSIVAEPVEVPLRNRAGETIAVALIDPCDAHLAEYRWHVMRARQIWYAERKSPGPNPKNVRLHREIMCPPAGMEIDHIDGDGLNCRRSNLRVVTHAHNLQNRRSDRGSSSRHRGVCWYAARGKWLAQATLDGRKHYLGYFVDEDEAAAAVSAWRLERMACTNEARAVINHLELMTEEEV